MAAILLGNPSEPLHANGMTVLLKQVHVQITPRRPPRAGDMPQPAAARLRALSPSGNAPTTRVRRLISRMMRDARVLAFPSEHW